MHWIPLILILPFQYLIVPCDDIARVLLQQVEDADVEVLMSLHRLGIMEDGGRQLPMLDIHVLESVAVLLNQQLVEEDLLEVYALNIKHRHQAVNVALVAHHVIAIPLLPVHVYILVDHCLWRAHLQGEVQRDILETK